MSRYNFGTLKQGDTVTATFKVQDGAGNAADLTGATITWTLAPAINRTTPSLTSNPTITAATSGRCALSIPAGSLPAPGIYYHELEVILATGDSFTASDGTMIIEPTTRPTT